MTAERPRTIAWIRLAVGTDKCPNRFHKNSNCLAQELLSFVPIRPQLESVTIVLFFSSFDIANLLSIIANGLFCAPGSDSGRRPYLYGRLLPLIPSPS
jgi:hypothetical protein